MACVGRKSETSGQLLVLLLLAVLLLVPCQVKDGTEHSRFEELSAEVRWRKFIRIYADFEVAVSFARSKGLSKV